jgi:Ser/Thr protein kinase RdoA (MazF antagonist)
MSLPSLESAAREVLRRFAVPSARLVALGNQGGFSGALLWRVEGGPEVLCLRAWPPGNPSPERLAAIHRLMGLARAAGLAFVPTVYQTTDGATWVESIGRLWDLSTWMPGRADFHARPDHRRLQAALTALGQVHASWAGAASSGPCPAVRRRLELVRRWLELTDAGWCPARLAIKDDPLRPWVERAWRLLPERVAGVPHRLAAWAERQLPLQPCLCDIWHDHVLFVGDAVSGIIDFGSIKTDHVAVDLARLLGSLVGSEPELRKMGIQAYLCVRALTAEEDALVEVLDETGTVLGAANWLMWLYRDEKQFEDRAAVARRFAELVQRIEAWG